MNADSDRKLINRFLKGDEEAFQVLVKRHEKPLYFFIFRMLGDHDETADICQATFVQVFLKVKGFMARSRFKTWLYRVAYNLSLNHIRSRGRMRTETLDEQRLDSAQEMHVSEPYDDNAGGRNRVLMNMIASLPEKQRLTLILRIYQEMSFKEIASVAGCSEGSAKVNYHHAITALRKTREENGLQESY